MNPLSGVASFVDSEDRERRLDFLKQVHGLEPDDIRDSAIEIEITRPEASPIPLWVMHPQRCMESRVRNSELTNKQTALAWRQLAASICCARAFSEYLLDDGATASLIAVRDLNERVFAFAAHLTSLRLFHERGIDVTHAVVADARLPELHLQRRLPQLRAQLERERARSRP